MGQEAMQDFEQQLLRIKQVLGVSEDQEVAEALGLSRAALSDRKRRNAFPEDKLYALAARRPDLKISPDFVLNGPGGTTLVEVKPAPVAPMGSAFGAAMELLIKRANQRGVHFTPASLGALGKGLQAYVERGGVVDEAAIDLALDSFVQAAGGAA